MLFALTDLQTRIEVPHIEAAMAWMRYATRSEISAECFRGHATKVQLDASLDHLLTATPPRIGVQWVERSVDAAGSATRIYRLA